MKYFNDSHSCFWNDTPTQPHPLPNTHTHTHVKTKIGQLDKDDRHWGQRLTDSWAKDKRDSFAKIEGHTHRQDRCKIINNLV